MSTTVICPNCNTQFEPTAAIAQSVREELSKEFNQKWVEKQRERDEQYRLREQQLLQQQADQQKRMEEERRVMEANLRTELQKKAAADVEARMRLLEDDNKTKDAKLAEAREKEMDFLKKMQDLKTREQEMELEMKRRMMEERTRLEDAIRKSEEEKNRLAIAEYDMKMRERDKQLEDQKKLIEEMKRKSEQGSMQLQGEVQELALEELLRNAFPFDVVSAVGKGMKGADCVLTVRNGFGQECGKIVFESKRTKEFSQDWIEKLKADARLLGSDAAVLVSQARPRDMESFGEKDGIWICSFKDVQALVSVLRDLVIKIYSARKSQENRGDKMSLLYSYLISSEFSEQWSAIREGFMGMRISLQKERDQMEKLWKVREKQLEKILLNATHISGSIEGIAGRDIQLDPLPGSDSLLLE